MSDAGTKADALVALMAREVEDGAVVATGVASPLAILAIAVAKATHAPRAAYLACVGSLDPRVERLHRASEDLAFLDGRSAEVSIPDLFDHARRGRLDTVFFGAAACGLTAFFTTFAAGFVPGFATFPAFASAQRRLRAWRMASRPAAVNPPRFFTGPALFCCFCRGGSATISPVPNPCEI